MDSEKHKQQRSEGFFYGALYAWRKSPKAFRTRTLLTALFLIAMIGLGLITSFVYKIAEDNDLTIVELFQVYQGKIDQMTGSGTSEIQE